MSWNPAGEHGTDHPRPIQSPPARQSDWIIARTTRQTLSLHAPDGSRRYELSYESHAHGRGRVSITGCDMNGELVTELQGDMALADVSVITQLLMGITGADPADDHGPAAPATGTPTPSAHAPRSGELWDAAETDRLAALHRDGTATTEIARRLQRSENSVRWKLHSLGLADSPTGLAPAPPAPGFEKAYTVEERRRDHPNAYKRWTPQEEATLALRCAQGAPLATLSEEFGRNEGAIASRLLKIHAEGPAMEEARDFGG